MSQREDAVVGQLTVRGAKDDGTTIKGFWKFSPNITPAAVGANTSVEQTFANALVTAQGNKALLATDDLIKVTGPAQPAGISLSENCRIGADGQLNITFINDTAGSLTPAAGVYKVFVIRT